MIWLKTKNVIYRNFLFSSFSPQRNIMNFCSFFGKKKKIKCLSFLNKKSALILKNMESISCSVCLEKFSWKKPGQLRRACLGCCNHAICVGCVNQMLCYDGSYSYKTIVGIQFRLPQCPVCKENFHRYFVLSKDGKKLEESWLADGFIT